MQGNKETGEPIKSEEDTSPPTEVEKDEGKSTEVSSPGEPPEDGTVADEEARPSSPGSPGTYS